MGWVARGRWPEEVLLAFSLCLFFLLSFHRPSCALLRRWGGGECGIPACRGGGGGDAGLGSGQPPGLPCPPPRLTAAGLRRGPRRARLLPPPWERALPPLRRRALPAVRRARSDSAGTLRGAPCPPLAFAEGGGGRSVPVPAALRYRLVPGVQSGVGGRGSNLCSGGGGPPLRELEDLLFSPIALDSPGKCQGAAGESPGQERGGRPELACGWSPADLTAPCPEGARPGSPAGLENLACLKLLWNYNWGLFVSAPALLA